MASTNSYYVLHVKLDQTIPPPTPTDEDDPIPVPNNIVDPDPIPQNILDESVKTFISDEFGKATRDVNDIVANLDSFTTDVESSASLDDVLQKFQSQPDFNILLDQYDSSFININEKTNDTISNYLQNTVDATNIEVSNFYFDTQSQFNNFIRRATTQNYKKRIQDVVDRMAQSDFDKIQNNEYKNMTDALSNETAAVDNVASKVDAKYKTYAFVSEAQTDADIQDLQNSKLIATATAKNSVTSIQNIKAIFEAKFSEFGDRFTTIDKKYQFRPDNTIRDAVYNFYKPINSMYSQQLSDLQSKNKQLENLIDGYISTLTQLKASRNVDTLLADSETKIGAIEKIAASLETDIDKTEKDFNDVRSRLRLYKKDVTNTATIQDAEDVRTNMINGFNDIDAIFQKMQKTYMNQIDDQLLDISLIKSQVSNNSALAQSDPNLQTKYNALDAKIGNVTRSFTLLKTEVDDIVANVYTFSSKRSDYIKKAQTHIQDLQLQSVPASLQLDNTTVKGISFVLGENSNENYTLSSNYTNDEAIDVTHKCLRYNIVDDTYSLHTFPTAGSNIMFTVWTKHIFILCPSSDDVSKWLHHVLENVEFQEFMKKSLDSTDKGYAANHIQSAQTPFTEAISHCIHFVSPNDVNSIIGASTTRTSVDSYEKTHRYLSNLLSYVDKILGSKYCPADYKASDEIKCLVLDYLLDGGEKNMLPVFTDAQKRASTLTNFTGSSVSGLVLKSIDTYNVVESTKFLNAYKSPDPVEIVSIYFLIFTTSLRVAYENSQINNRLLYDGKNMLSTLNYVAQYVDDSVVVQRTNAQFVKNAQFDPALLKFKNKQNSKIYFEYVQPTRPSTRAISFQIGYVIDPVTGEYTSFHTPKSTVDVKKLWLFDNYANAFAALLSQTLPYSARPYNIPLTQLSKQAYEKIDINGAPKSIENILVKDIIETYVSYISVKYATRFQACMAIETGTDVRHCYLTTNDNLPTPFDNKSESYGEMNSLIIGEYDATLPSNTMVKTIARPDKKSDIFIFPSLVFTDEKRTNVDISFIGLYEIIIDSTTTNNVSACCVFTTKKSVGPAPTDVFVTNKNTNVIVDYIVASKSGAENLSLSETPDRLDINDWKSSDRLNTFAPDDVKRFLVDGSLFVLYSYDTSSKSIGFQNTLFQKSDDDTITYNNTTNEYSIGLIKFKIDTDRSNRECLRLFDVTFPDGSYDSKTYKAPVLVTKDLLSSTQPVFSSYLFLTVFKYSEISSLRGNNNMKASLYKAIQKYLTSSAFAKNTYYRNIFEYSLVRVDDNIDTMSVQLTYPPSVFDSYKLAIAQESPIPQISKHDATKFDSVEIQLVMSTIDGFSTTKKLKFNVSKDAQVINLDTTAKNNQVLYVGSDVAEYYLKRKMEKYGTRDTSGVVVENTNPSFLIDSTTVYNLTFKTDKMSDAAKIIENQNLFVPIPGKQYYPGLVAPGGSLIREINFKYLDMNFIIFLVLQTPRVRSSLTEVYLGHVGLLYYPQ